MPHRTASPRNWKNCLRKSVKSVDKTPLIILTKPEPNIPCPKGEALGKEIARLTPIVPDMCFSCAFRLGTVPNRCLQTLLGAVNSVLDGVPFYCHIKHDAEGREKICAGYLSATKDINWGANLNL